MKVEFEPKGIIRQIDDLGRIVLPKDYRENVGIKIGESFEIFVDRKGNFYIKRLESEVEQ